MEKNLRSGVRLAALALWFLGVVAMQADRFFADFDDVQNDLGKFEAGQNQNPPPPAVTNDVQGGNSFIRMTWGTTLNLSSLTYDLDTGDGGLFGRVEADFDFRMSGVGDGFGFILLSTEIYGRKEIVPRQGFVGAQVYQEPTALQSLGIGFDFFQGTEGRQELNGNHVSVHFHEKLLQEFDAGPVDLNSGGWIHAKIIARPGGTNSDVSLVLTPQGGQPFTVFTNYVVSDFVAAETRPHFGARSGSFDLGTIDLDNLDINYLEPAPVAFEFGFTNVATVESENPLIYISKVGNSPATVSVNYATADGTALAGDEYQTAAGTISFAPGEDPIKLIPITIIDDSDLEPTRTFSVALTGSSAGTLIGARNVANVAIHDDDDPSFVGKWDPVVRSMPLNAAGGQSSVVAIHLNLLPTGQILLWDRHGSVSGTDGNPRLWDPVTGVFEAAATQDYDLFCAGHALMADGRLFVPGGHILDGMGEVKAAIYDPWSNAWTQLPDMNAGRWYPTATMLANGDMLVEAGTIDIPQDVNRLSQIWQVASGTWKNLTTAEPQHGRFPIWANYYPFMYQAGNGKVFCAGPQQMARWLDISGTGNWEDVAESSLLYRDYGTSVMYADGKILITGGNPPEIYTTTSILGTTATIYPSRVTELIDINEPNPTWRATTPMNSGRRHATATLLPDGKVLVTGGSSSPGFNIHAGAVRWAEIWDPETERWTPLAAAQRYNGYHCNALLLPDGRVVTTGGGHPNPPDAPTAGEAPEFGAEPSAEFYHPSYLFNGARPSITSAPSAVTYGETFYVETPDAANVAKVSWIKLGNTTHAFNQNQRINFLSFTNSAGGIWCAAPDNPYLCTPGHYMMFLLNSNGVPSVASIVRVAMGILSVAEQGSDNLITVTTVPGNNYRVEYTDTLPATGWTTVGTAVSASANTTQVTDVNGASALNRFYRVQQVP
ncbi:MAG: DUF1929 domain-containing protein [Verrucomicrobiae bacterium]|nr:DUF1929 domain-containing protein [Verrucomicrobiae bacterium]